MADDKIKVIIADDQVSTRRALKALLTFEPRIEITGEAGDGSEAIRLVGTLLPDLVLIDVQMPVMNGIKATQQIKTMWPGIKVIVYTMFPGYQQEAYQAGADYFLIKGSLGFTPSQIILSFFPLKDMDGKEQQ